MEHDKYFAARKVKELADALTKKKDEYYQYLETNGMFRLLRNVYNSYHKPALRSGEIVISGDQGQLLNISVNHFRSLVQRKVSFITSERPHFEPKAINTDTKSMFQAQLASSVLEYYNRVKKMERFSRDAVEQALMYGESFVSVTWNPNIGAEVTKDLNDNTVREGDIEFKTLLGIDVIRDASLRDAEQNQWYIIREFKNKWDLIASYPDKKEAILKACDTSNANQRWSLRFYENATYQTPDTDMVELFTFYHDKGEALPDGRMTEFLDADTVLFDGPLAYDSKPVYRISAGEHTESIFGYTDSFDLVPLQTTLDKLHSTIVSNQAAFGVQNIAMPKGSDLNSTEIAGNLNIIEYDAKMGPPQPIQLLSTPAEIFNYAQQLVSEMETISGVNSVARGNPEASLRSGNALALVQSQAIQSSQVLQQSYIQLLEDMGTAVVDLLKTYAAVPRIALISGKSNRYKLQEFKGSDLDRINRVMVDVGNPLTRTVAGRYQLAEVLTQQGLVKNPQQILEVLTTGRLEPMYESELNELNLIRSENEQLSDGEQAVAIRTDNHQLHIAEHLSVLSTPEARQDPARVEAVLAHVAEHERMMQEIAMGGGMITPQQAPVNAGTNGIAQTEQGITPEVLGAAGSVQEQASNIEQPMAPSVPEGLEG